MPVSLLLRSLALACALVACAAASARAATVSLSSGVLTYTAATKEGNVVTFESAAGVRGRSRARGARLVLRVGPDFRRRDERGQRRAVRVGAWGARRGPSRGRLAARRVRRLRARRRPPAVPGARGDRRQRRERQRHG